MKYATTMLEIVQFGFWNSRVAVFVKPHCQIKVYDFLVGLHLERIYRFFLLISIE